MVALIAMVSVSCSKKAKAPEEFKIGAIFASTGPASMLGLPEKNTVDMLEKAINESGGINGTKVNLVFYDTGGDATKTVTNTKKLIEKDMVDVIIGPTTSGNTLAIIDVVEEAQIPPISCAASVRIVDPVKNWVFKTPQTDVMAVEKIYEKLQKEGEEGRRKITQYTRYLTVLIASLQAFGTAQFLISLEVPGGQIVHMPTALFVPLTMLTFTCGTIFIMWLGEKITEKGIGNGVS